MRLLLTLALCLCLSSAFGQATSPAKGSAERTAILNVLRTPVQSELKTKVQFKVDLLKVQDGWAFLKGVPQKANGGKVDFRKTKYQSAIDAGAFDNWICALLKKKAGKWTVVTYVIGATDVAYEPWPKQYGAPRAIFDLGG